MSGSNVINVTEATWEQAVIQASHDDLILVDFWAPWCGPCRMLGPILERLAAEPGSPFVLAKINVDENQSLSMRYQVQGIPAVKAFRDGVVVGDFVGARPESFVRNFVSELAPSGGIDDLSAGLNLLEKRDWSGAETALRELLAEQPDHATGRLGLARALLGQGKGEAAQTLLAMITNGPEFAVAERLGPLTGYLVKAETKWRDDDEVTPLEAQYRHAARLINRGNIPAALDGLLDVLRQDKQYGKGKARSVMLSLFELLGADSPISRQYRQELASVLF